MGLMTLLIVTSSSTGTEPTLEVTMSILSPTVFPHALTVPVSTHSSTLLMLLTNKLSPSLQLLLPGTSSPLVSSSLTDLNQDSTLTWHFMVKIKEVAEHFKILDAEGNER